MESISDHVADVESSLSDQLLRIYVFVDDFLKAHPSCAQWRRSNNHAPAFTDAEVLTIGLAQGCLGCCTLKKTYRLIADNYRDAFPKLCSYQQWIERLHALGAITGQLIQAALGIQGLDDRHVYIIDGKPIPVCKPIRHGRVRLLREDGAYFGKNSTGWFFGFKLHILIHASGSVISAILTPGNWDEKDVALALGLSVEGGIVLGDLGYRSRDDELDSAMSEEANLLLITPDDAGDKNTPRRILISSVRERVETTFGALWARFVDRVYSRSWNGLWSTIRLKLLHFNLCQANLIAA